MSGYSSATGAEGTDGRTERLPVDARVRPDDSQPDYPAEGAYVSQTERSLADGTFRPSVQVISCQGTLQVEEYPVF
jgi:hypothetical protein